MVDPQRIMRGIKRFLEIEAASGIFLGLSAIVAMLLANSFLSDLYFEFLKTKIFGLTIKYWINDGLMAIFFFVVGLEIKKELVLGHLNSPKKAALPLFAAIGGMLVPALIYYFLNPTGVESQGWGIPMATDIAFAVGVLTILGAAVPLSLKIFLLAVAIVDDLGAILVIAFFYTNEIRGMGLALALAGIGAAMLLRYSGVRNYAIYTVFGVLVWVGFLYSGVHATIAGVLMGLLTPTRYPVERGVEDTYSPLEELIEMLHHWVSYLIMPLFALANAGIDLRQVDLLEVFFHPVHLGVVLGLVLGKPVGILVASLIAVKSGYAVLPLGLGWRHILGVGCLAGIGFTMSLFISALALPESLEVYSKTGIVLASLVSGLLGCIVMKLRGISKS